MRIIEKPDDEKPDEVAFTFKVYRSPKDGTRILGYLEPYGFQSGSREVSWIKTPYGVSAAEAFPQVVALAEQYGAHAIRIDDPDGLFPPSDRPVTRVGS